jgi:hypothetical protein
MVETPGRDLTQQATWRVPAMPDNPHTTNPSDTDPIVAAVAEYIRLREIGRRLDREADDLNLVLRPEADRAAEAENTAMLRLARTKPRTPAGAGAALLFIAEDMDYLPADWHTDALRTIAEALRGMRPMVFRR